MTKKPQVIIVGAGILGLASAYYLLRDHPDQMLRSLHYHVGFDTGGPQGRHEVGNGKRDHRQEEQHRQQVRIEVWNYLQLRIKNRPALKNLNQKRPPGESE